MVKLSVSAFREVLELSAKGALHSALFAFWNFSSMMNNGFDNNSIYLHRRGKVLLPKGLGDVLPLNYVASVMRNIETLGFTFSQSLMDACRTLSREQLTAFYQTLVPDLQNAKGAHREFKPMYPNFPAQVMAMAESALYLNAVIHYLTDGRWKLQASPELRLPLWEEVAPQVLEIGSVEEFETLFSQIASSNTSLSEQDKEDLTWFVSSYGDDIARLLPASVPQKENMAFLAGLLMTHTRQAELFLNKYCRTATDVLRLAVALSGGDVSLAQTSKFRTFSRPERRLLLGLLERKSNLAEEMRRWNGRWIRLGEKLHVGEYANSYPLTASAFDVLRNDKRLSTFNSQVEQALATSRFSDALTLLKSRPGEFARRLDHLLRLDVSGQNSVLDAFSQVADKISTPVLLQVGAHFQFRGNLGPLRVFFPKGDLAKSHAEDNQLSALAEDVCRHAVELCSDALVARFRALPPLGKCYLDPKLADYPVPFSARSASKSFRTLTRGSKIPLPADCRVLRFFVWWKNGRGRTDIDLSAAMFDGEFGFKNIVSYYNLKNYGGVHSGDIVDAPEGASEFIDITLESVRKASIRYVVMTLQSYTQQPYSELPECFAGWMARADAGSGEIYEPRTVQNRLDLTAETRIAIPLVVDVQKNEVIWCDMALRRHPNWQNNVHGNLSAIALTLQSLTTLQRASLYDLFRLHIEARGEPVNSAAEAEKVFSVENETPYRLEEIASEFLM